MIQKEIETRLYKYLEKYNLFEFKDYMMSIVKPVINIIYEESNIKNEYEIELGCSKFLGLPHLPQNFNLPINEKFGLNPYADAPT